MIVARAVAERLLGTPNAILNVCGRQCPCIFMSGVYGQLRRGRWVLEPKSNALFFERLHKCFPLRKPRAFLFSRGIVLLSRKSEERYVLELLSRPEWRY